VRARSSACGARPCGVAGLSPGLTAGGGVQRPSSAASRAGWRAIGWWVSQAIAASSSSSLDDMRHMGTRPSSDLAADIVNEQFTAPCSPQLTPPAAEVPAQPPLERRAKAASSNEQLVVAVIRRRWEARRAPTLSRSTPPAGGGASAPSLAAHPFSLGRTGHAWGSAHAWRARLDALWARLGFCASGRDSQGFPLASSRTPAPG
jgi:hypothetical protein